MKQLIIVFVVLLCAIGFSVLTEREALVAARSHAEASFSRGDYEPFENWIEEGWLRVVTDPDYEFYRTLTTIALQQAYRYALYLELNSLYFAYLDQNPGMADNIFYNARVKTTLEVMPKAQDEIPQFVSSIRKEEQVVALIKEIARTKRSEVTPMFVNLRMTVPMNKYHVFLFPESWRSSLRDEIVKLSQVRRTTTIVTYAGIPALVVLGILGLVVFRRRKRKKGGR